MGLWWAYVGSLGGSAGPMFGLCWAKRCRHLGLCSANFNPDLRKIRSGLRKTALFRAMPQPYWAYPVPSWGYVGPILQQLAHPLLGLHVAILHCIKLNLTWRIFGLKWGCPATCKYISGIFCLDGTSQHGMETKEQCMCMCIYVFFYILNHIDLFFLFIYLFLSFYLFTYFFKIDACIST